MCDYLRSEIIESNTAVDNLTANWFVGVVRCKVNYVVSRTHQDWLDHIFLKALTKSALGRPTDFHLKDAHTQCKSKKS